MRTVYLYTYICLILLLLLLLLKQEIYIQEELLDAKSALYRIYVWRKKKEQRRYLDLVLFKKI